MVNLSATVCMAAEGGEVVEVEVDVEEVEPVDAVAKLRYIIDLLETPVSQPPA